MKMSIIVFEWITDTFNGLLHTLLANYLLRVRLNINWMLQGQVGKSVQAY